MAWDDPNLHQIASEFFRTFSRMEYALKAAGFLVRNQRKAEADWGRFALEVEAALASSEPAEIQGAITFVLTEPPKKQVNVNNFIEWDTTPPDAANRAELLLRYVCRVRNNLFHGGKFNGHWFQPERSGELLHASLIILDACRKACPAVDRAYHSES